LDRAGESAWRYRSRRLGRAAVVCNAKHGSVRAHHAVQFSQSRRLQLARAVAGSSRRLLVTHPGQPSRRSGLAPADLPRCVRPLSAAGTAPANPPPLDNPYGLLAGLAKATSDARALRLGLLGGLASQPADKPWSILGSLDDLAWSPPPTGSDGFSGAGNGPVAGNNASGLSPNPGYPPFDASLGILGAIPKLLGANSVSPNPPGSSSPTVPDSGPEAGGGPSVPQATGGNSGNQQLAQELFLFARPFIVPPRGMTPLDELPPGSAGGDYAGRVFPRSSNSQQPRDVPCAYCGTPTTRAPGPRQFHGDHVIPRSQGGNSSPENFLPSCRTCNLDKGARTPSQWYMFRGWST
jgi:HNH endonuclease